jgi:hypothetical protein
MSYDWSLFVVLLNVKLRKHHNRSVIQRSFMRKVIHTKNGVYLRQILILIKSCEYSSDVSNMSIHAVFVQFSKPSTHITKTNTHNF